MSPFLSIIIPVYNVEDYIEECLSSILPQCPKNGFVEIIIVNDGTPDKSMDIVQRMTFGYSFVTILEQENKGLSAARMAGLNVAKGNFIWFVDSDDLLFPDAVEQVLSMLKKDSSIDVLVFPLLWCYPEALHNRVDISYDVIRTNKGKDYLRHQAFNCWAVPRYIINHTLFDNPYLFFPKGLLHEDEYFGRVLLYISSNVHILYRNIYVYRQRASSIVHQITIRNSYDIVEIYRLLSFFMDNVVQIEDRRWFSSQILGLLTECYTRNVELFGTPAFKRFIRDKRKFILREYVRHSVGFPITRRIADIWLFLSPRFFDFFMRLYNRNKGVYTI